MKTARQKESGNVQTVGSENLEICTLRGGEKKRQTTYRRVVTYTESGEYK